VDTRICEAVALGVSALTGVPVVPPLAYGVSGSHGDFGGTVALRPETLIAVVEDVVDSLHARGIRQFVLLNAPIWNNGSLDVTDATAEHGRDEFNRCVLTTARAVSAAVREPWPDPKHRP